MQDSCQLLPSKSFYSNYCKEKYLISELTILLMALPLCCLCVSMLAYGSIITATVVLSVFGFGKPASCLGLGCNTADLVLVTNIHSKVFFGC